MNEELLVSIIRSLFAGYFFYYISVQVNERNYKVRNVQKIIYLIISIFSAYIMVAFIEQPERLIVLVLLYSVINKKIMKNTYTFSVILTFYSMLIGVFADIFSSMLFSVLIGTIVNFKVAQHILIIHIFMFVFIFIVVKITRNRVADMEKTLWSKNKKIGSFIILTCIGILIILFILQPMNNIIAHLSNQISLGHRWFILSFVLIFIIVLYLLISICLINIYSKYKELSQMDVMTGTINKSIGLKYIEECMNRANSRNQSLILCFIDIDNLKIVNDTYGHNEGDILIKTTIDTIKENIRKSDKIIRFGGDEFIIVFQNTNNDMVRKIIGRINKNLDNINNEKAYTYKLEMSHGFAEYDKEKNISVYDFIEEADKNMYQFKKKRKGILSS